MATASLRLKFSPLIQYFHKKGSKCCLEIVPEVSCIQNLEMIDWQEKSNFIEYTIPMTYKLIIRKRQVEQNSNHDLDKVYHSCVDLTPPSSSHISLGCGDNNARMVSDTFIYDSLKATAGIDMITKKISNAEYSTKSNNDVNNTQVDGNIAMLDKLLNDISTENNSMNDKSVAKVDASTSQMIAKNVDITDNDSLVENACKYNTSCTEVEIYKESKNDCDKAGTVTSMPSNKVGSLQKLSVTPVYSIDTVAYETDQNTPMLSLYSALNNFYKPLKMFTKPMKIQVYDTENKVENRKLFSTYKRELPEVRVTNFMKKMETEIMPLKIILNDILRKCTTMGLLTNESKIYNEYGSINKRLMKNCTSEKQPEYNRVVYSMVFDG